jgi:hypothetical protein
LLPSSEAIWPDPERFEQHGKISFGAILKSFLIHNFREFGAEGAEKM